MALSRNRLSSQTSGKKEPAPSVSPPEETDQSAADEIEKLLSGFCLGETLDASGQPSDAPAVPSPSGGAPSAEHAEPLVAIDVDTPAAPLDGLRGAGAISFEDIPPAITTDSPAVTSRPAVAHPGPSAPPSVESPAGVEEGFLLDDFVLPDATEESSDSPDVAKEALEQPVVEPPPPSDSAATIGGASPEPPPLPPEVKEGTADGPTDGLSGRKSSKKRERPRKEKRVRVKRPRSEKGDHRNAIAVLVVFLVVGGYGFFYYGADLIPGLGKKIKEPLSKAASISSVPEKVTKTLRKVTEKRKEEEQELSGQTAVPTPTVASPEPDASFPAPAVTSAVPAVALAEPAVTSAVPAVAPAAPAVTSAAPAVALAESLPAPAEKEASEVVEAVIPKEVPEIESSSEMPRPGLAVAGREPEEIASADDPEVELPDGSVLEGNEIVPAKSDFVEWPEIQVTAVIGRGDEGAAIINSEVIRIGEPCAAGPILRTVAPMKATFEWNGDTRDYFLNTKTWGSIKPAKNR